MDQAFVWPQIQVVDPILETNWLNFRFPTYLSIIILVRVVVRLL